MTWAESSRLGATLFALLLSLGCGKVDERESGETHFVRCEIDDDCASLGASYSCLRGECRVEESTGIDDSPDPACTACSTECLYPGSCNLSAVCADGACNSALSDENACLRPSCASDADCPDDERCLSDFLSRRYECQQAGDTCECEIGLSLSPVKVCSPVELVGPRGTWQTISVEESVIGDVTTWEASPDGSLTVERSGDSDTPGTSTAQLDPADLEELSQLIDGPELRLQLESGASCEPPKSKDDMVRLVLDSGEPLTKNVAGCLDVPAFERLLQLLSKY